LSEKKGEGVSPKVQIAIDMLVSSTGHSVSSNDAMLVFVEWAQGDGWNDCVRAWEEAGETVVTAWAPFCKDFANEKSLEDYCAADPMELTVGHRLDHLNARLQEVYADPSSSHSWTVHPLDVQTSSGGHAVIGVLAQSGGPGGFYLSVFGVFETQKQALDGLFASGYRRCDVEITADEAIKVWLK
jgi:hypothetical protein